MKRLPLFPSAESTASRAPQRPLLAGREKDRLYQPRYAVWELTLRCDLSCSHCGSRAGHARPDELSRDEAVQLVGELAALGVKEVTLIGGEAYLHDGWLDVVRAIRSHNMLVSITSGGRGFTAERANAAAEAGVQSVSLSIDGISAVHDDIRGLKGAYDSLLTSWENLKSAGIVVAANTSLNRKNWHQLEEIYEQVKAVECHGWQVFLTVPMGRASDNPDLILQPIDLIDLMPRLQLIHARGAQEGVRVLPGNNVGYFGPGEHQLRHGLREPEHAACQAGRGTIGIEANGDIKGCPSLPSKDWVGGNVRQSPLRDIWERSAQLRYTRDMTVESHNWGFCKTCYYADVCKGGCTWTSSLLFGKPGNNPYCHHRSLHFSKRGLYERLVRSKASPGEPFDYALWEISVERTSTISG